MTYVMNNKSETIYYRTLTAIFLCSDLPAAPHITKPSVLSDLNLKLNL